jgi:membrane protease YdiL (CAAX protease family)
MDKETKAYLLLTLGGTGVLWLSLGALIRFGGFSLKSPLAVMYILGGVMPALAAIWAKKQYTSREDFKVFLKNIVGIKQPAAWYGLALILAALYCFLPYMLGGAELRQPVYMFLLEIPVMIVGGGLEEIGWRGLLLPKLQKKYSVLLSALIVAGIWFVWHLPLWLIPGVNQEKMNLLWFAINILSLSLMLTAITNKTKSIFMAIFFHACINAGWDVFLPNNAILPALAQLALAAGVFVWGEYKERFFSK